MSALVIVTLAFAPGIFWLWFFYKKDKWEPEPKRLIVETFIWGMLAVIPVAIVEYPFRSPWFAGAVVAAPIIEEFAKLLVVCLAVFKNVEFNEPMDGITYSAAAALGFASIENSFYLLREYNDSASSGVISLFLIRALLSVPGHVLFSSMWGYALGWSKFSKDKRPARLVLNGYLLAVGLHGLFNFLASRELLGSLAMLLLAWIMWRTVLRKINTSLRASPFAHEETDAILLSEEERGTENDPNEE